MRRGGCRREKTGFSNGGLKILRKMTRICGFEESAKSLTVVRVYITGIWQSSPLHVYIDSRATGLKENTLDSY